MQRQFVVVPTKLRGDTLLLEPLDERHAPDLLAHCDLTSLAYMRNKPQELTPEAMERYIESLKSTPAMVPFAIVLLATGQAVGVTTYMHIRPADRGLEIGSTWISPRYWGTRVNPESKYLLLEHAFERLGAIRVELRTDSRNVRSQRAIEKLGAVREGVLRRHMIMPDGYVRDTVVYAITDQDWPQVRDTLRIRLRSSEC